MKTEPIIVRLKFVDHPSSLAGNAYGQETFDKQIKPLLPKPLPKAASIRIVFPSEIERIAISYMLGLTKELAENFGRASLEEHVTFSTNSKELDRKIARDILFI